MTFAFLAPIIITASAIPAIAGSFDTPATLSREVTVPNPPEEVWQAFGQFCSLTKWQNLVASCEVTQKPEGIHRTAVMTDNTAYVERLVFYSEEQMAFGYSMLSGPAPVKDYVALFDVDPAKQGGSIIRISAWYGTADGAAPEAVATALGDLFENGLKGMDAALGD